MRAHTNQFIWFQGKSCVSSTFCSRCWKTLEWRIACPGFLRQWGFSASPPHIKNTWLHSGVSSRATEGPWPTRRCPVPWETIPAQAKSSKWERNWPTSLAEPPWLHWGASREWRMPKDDFFLISFMILCPSLISSLMKLWSSYSVQCDLCQLEVFHNKSWH